MNKAIVEMNAEGVAVKYWRGTTKRTVDGVKNTTVKVWGILAIGETDIQIHKPIRAFRSAANTGADLEGESPLVTALASRVNFLLGLEAEGYRRMMASTAGRKAVAGHEVVAGGKLRQVVQSFDIPEEDPVEQAG